MTLNSKTRQVWAEKIIDLANIAAGALIFGQFISNKQFSPVLGLIGFILVLTGYIISFVLLRKK